MITILLIILLLALIGAFPVWPYNTGRGYYPSGGLGLLLLILIVVLLTRRRPAVLACSATEPEPTSSRSF